MSVVEDLPRRVAHATHALLVASREFGQTSGMPTALEVLVYDGESLSVRSTSAALRAAAARGLVMHVPPRYWVARGSAHVLEGELEERYLRETADE